MARKRQSGRTRTNRFGSFCLILQALISIIFMIVVVLLDMLPGNYLALVAMILVFLWCNAPRKLSGSCSDDIGVFVVYCLYISGSQKEKRDCRKDIQSAYGVRPGIWNI